MGRDAKKKGEERALRAGHEKVGGSDRFEG